MKRILLINPPFYRLLGSHYNANSLGIAYIASVLNQHGHDAWVYNADHVSSKEYKDLSSLFTGFEDYKSYFKDEDNDLWQEIVEKIIEFRPDWIGYTSYTANLSAINVISKLVNKRIPKVIQVVGGVHATLDPDTLDKLPYINYAVQREGEYAMLQLINGEDPVKISGVTSRTPFGKQGGGDAEKIKNIDLLPFPERDKLWGLDDASKKEVDVSYICSIRGCPYKCTYCASPFHWKRNKTQFRSPESILNEMKHLHDNYWNDIGVDYAASANTKSKNKLIINDNTIVYFVDDVFTVRKKRVKEILRGMIDSGLSMPWKCEARTDHFDEEICDLMKQAGCVRVKLGFESGSDRILEQVKKGETKQQMLDGARMLKNAGVPFTGYFMTGFPGETDEDLKETIEFAQQIDADYYSLSVLAPYYGTEIYNTLIEDGYQLDKKPWEYFFHQSPELMVNNLISEDVLKEYLSLNELNSNKKGYT
jgi:anaerobic magnesium-protoporphyrin IX monomethyl ester cyclase